MYNYDPENDFTPIFMPLEKITCYKQPNGIYKLTFFKADSNDPPMEILVDALSRYYIVYRYFDEEDPEFSGTLDYFENATIYDVYCSDGSDPDQYCQCIDEGFYHRLPNKIEPFEIDNPVQLMLAYRYYVDYEYKNIKTQDVYEIYVDDEKFTYTVNFKKGDYIFTAIEKDNNIIWYLSGKPVNLNDYGISIDEENQSDGDFITVSISFASFPACNMLDLHFVMKEPPYYYSKYENIYLINFINNEFAEENIVPVLNNNGDIFIDKILENTDDPVGTYSFTAVEENDKIVWYLSDEIVDLKDYGIKITCGDPSNGDSFGVEIEDWYMS